MLSQSINLESEEHSPLISNLVVSFLGLRNVFELSLFPNLIFHADGFKQSMVKKSSKDMGFQFILTYFDKLSHKNNFSKKFDQRTFGQIVRILVKNMTNMLLTVQFIVCMTMTIAREYCSYPVSIYPTLYSVSQTGESISLCCSCHKNSIFSVTIVIFFVLFITF